MQFSYQNIMKDNSLINQAYSQESIPENSTICNLAINKQ
jgi:hypothetical protein